MSQLNFKFVQAHRPNNPQSRNEEGNHYNTEHKQVKLWHLLGLFPV